LIEYARRYQAEKRGGGRQPISFDESAIAAADSSESLLALDDALTRLGALDERLAKVVECRYFGGLTEDETARALGVTARTVRRRRDLSGDAGLRGGTAADRARGGDGRSDHVGRALRSVPHDPGDRTRRHGRGLPGRA